MADFFARNCGLSAGVYDPDAPRIRQNAYVTVGSLPLGLKDHSETYKGTRKAYPTLDSVKTTLEGMAGALRKCEFSFTCYDVDQFNDLEEELLLPGNEVDITYGYVKDGLTGATSGNYTFTIYDYSFELTKENYYKCSAKGIGKGMTFEEENMNAAKIFPEKNFITNYAGANEKAKTQNLFDYIDWIVQDGMGQSGDWVFDPKNGKTSTKHVSGENKGAYYGCLTAPKSYEPEVGKFETGNYTSDRLIYMSLAAIINIINKHFLKGFGYTIQFHSEYSRLSTKINGIRIFSANPVDFLFRYTNCKENSYPHKKKHLNNAGKSPKRLASGGKRKYISANDFSGGSTLSTGTSMPGAILVSRDFMRALQKSFSDAATQEKSDEETENKTASQITIRQFFNKLFAAIRENSGGAWDLYLDQDDQKAGSRDVVYVINKRCPSDGALQICDLTPDGDQLGVREIKLNGKVPKAFQAKFAGGAPDTGPSDEEVASNRIQKESDTKNEASVPDAKSAAEARMKVHTSDFDHSSINACKATLKAIVENQSGNNKIKTGQQKSGTDFKDTPFPLEFSAVIDGNDDFEFGHAIGATGVLPSRYKGSNKVVFTITDIEHNIEGNDWSTTLNAIMRLR